MGGDGGTLNNSRHEHTRLRRAVFGTPDEATRAAQLRQRASTTHCALTNLPLRPPHVVCDRVGQLYGKEAVLRHLLRRASRQTAQGAGVEGAEGGAEATRYDALAHVRSVKHDTVDVSLIVEAGTRESTSRDDGEACANVRHDDDDDAARIFMCPVTMRAIVPTGRFSVGWRCGCVVADCIPVEKAPPSHAASKADRVSDHVAHQKEDRICIACGEVGMRVALGLTFQQRKQKLKELGEERAGRRTRRKMNGRGVKRKRQVVACDGGVDDTEGRETPMDVPQKAKLPRVEGEDGCTTATEGT